MKFIKVKDRRGFNYDHGTKFTVTDLRRSDSLFSYEAGTNRMPRRDSKYWGARYMVWDVEGNYQINKPAIFEEP